MLATLDRPHHTPAARPAAPTLARDGYTILPGALPTATIAGLAADLAPRFAATPFCEGDFYGWRTKRFGSLLKRSPHAAALVAHPRILAIAGEVLGDACDTIQLNLAQATGVFPGERAQFPHRDEDMWGGPKGGFEYLLNVIWPLTRFTADNGATQIWPDSHRHRDIDPETQTPVAAEIEPGDALLFLGSTLHGAGANRTVASRTAIIVSYCLGWLKPYENQWLVYPPEVARTFPRPLAQLVGYRQHRPNLGNYEGRCPSELLDGPIADHLAAADALTPAQMLEAADYVART